MIETRNERLARISVRFNRNTLNSNPNWNAMHENALTDMDTKVHFGLYPKPDFIEIPF